jgi:FAD/FMN-containing dehydrogenase/Fe-S oxidoreductase
MSDLSEAKNLTGLPTAATTDVAELLARRLRTDTQAEVLFTPADRGRYATDASIYQVMPLGVLVPKTDADVATALAICRDLKVPIVPRGGGTSQCGQTVGAGLVIDHSKHLRRMLNVDADAHTATVEPGIVLDHLNAQLKANPATKHLWFAVDVSTAAQATLGGMTGNNSCGSRSIAYGNMVHNVLGASAHLADGTMADFGLFSQASGRALAIGQAVQAMAQRLRPEIDAHWPKVMRRVAGYNLDIFCNQSERPYTTDGSVNLAHLLVGSEGTLALTRSLTLRLSELPRAKVLGVVNFPTFRAAMAAAQHIVTLSPTAVELVDRTMIDLSLANPAFAPTIRTALNAANGEPQAILLVEFSGAAKSELLPQLKRLDDLMGSLGLPGSVVHMADDAPQKNLWEVRKAGLNIMMSLKGDGKPVSFIEDCAVPLQHLADYTDALTEVFARHGTKGTWYAHASVGTLHVRPILDMRVAGEHGGAAKMRSIANEAAALVRKFKGAYSGEHGDGLCRGEWIEWQFGPAITQAFGDIKALMDPDGLLCPQRMVGTAQAPVPRMDDTRLMRYSPEYRVIPLQPALDWQAWNVQNNPATEETTAPGTGGDPAQGFAKAVEMCNNNGHCRKFDAGTMCPSYRVTRDEQHLTRGRANTLRLALSGQLGPDGLTSDAVKDAMDLCVGCKGCKRDCPTGVDMARMKVEFLHHYKARHGRTLKDRLISHLPDYGPVAARLAPVLNLRNRWRWLARLTERFVGISAQRSLPAWRADTFDVVAVDLTLASCDKLLAAHHDGKPAVVLLVDTFNRFFESENAVAAVRVLQAAGCTVHAAQADDGAALCCGRTHLAVGDVAAARAKLSTLVGTLAPLAQHGIPIVGLEPSCLLTLRDEALAMGLGEAADAVAKQALLIEEYLAREAKAESSVASALQAKLKPLEAPLLVHGHCHQKAFGVMSPVLEVLKLIPGATPALIESSCCGMAGSFGYDAEHHAVSMQMAELALLPAVRAQPHAVVVADGTSCRHQIADGAARQAVHAAVLLARQLG